MREARLQAPPSWLERELSAGLAPVTAPPDLWPDIASGIQPEQSVSGRQIAWPVAAVAMLALMSLTVYRFVATQSQVSNLRQAAMAHTNLEALDFHTGSCAELNDWLKQNAGMDVPLPQAAPGVELLGARILPAPGSPIAAIAYRVAGSAATLFVTRAHSRSDSPHNFTRTASVGGPELISWGMRDLEYALVAASSTDPHAGCRLCHAR
jgi:hypothetical protein